MSIISISLRRFEKINYAAIGGGEVQVKIDKRFLNPLAVTNIAAILHLGGKRIYLPENGKITIGRGIKNDFRILDPKVDLDHAIILHAVDGIRIVNLSAKSVSAIGTDEKPINIKADPELEGTLLPDEARVLFGISGANKMGNGRYLELKVETPREINEDLALVLAFQAPRPKVVEIAPEEAVANQQLNQHEATLKQMQEEADTAGRESLLGKTIEPDSDELMERLIEPPQPAPVAVNPFAARLAAAKAQPKAEEPAVLEPEAVTNSTVVTMNISNVIKLIRILGSSKDKNENNSAKILYRFFAGKHYVELANKLAEISVAEAHRAILDAALDEITPEEAMVRIEDMKNRGLTIAHPINQKLVEGTIFQGVRSIEELLTVYFQRKKLGKDGINKFNTARAKVWGTVAVVSGAVSALFGVAGALTNSPLLSIIGIIFSISIISIFYSVAMFILSYHPEDEGDLLAHEYEFKGILIGLRAEELAGALAARSHGEREFILAIVGEIGAEKASQIRKILKEATSIALLTEKNK